MKSIFLRKKNRMLFSVIFLLFLFIFFVVNYISASVYIIPVEGEINPGMVNLVERGISEAENMQAEHIIFRINSQGGLADSAIQIKDQIFATHIATTSFIVNRAWSGAALIALAAQNIIMQQGSSIGSAETIPREEKFISAIRQEFRATAEKRGRDGELAAAMVDSDLEIEGVIERNKLLNLDFIQAEETGIADVIVNNFAEIITFLDLDQRETIIIEQTRLERFAELLTRPHISAFLLIFAFMAFAFEMMIPGFGIGGTSALISLGLFFTGHMIHGYAGWGLIILFMAGIILLIIEIFVVPGFGVTGIGGIIAIFSSLFFVFPRTETALWVMISVLFFSVTGFLILLKIFGSSRLWRRLSLGYSETIDRGYTASNNRSDLLGAEGRAETPLRPSGIAIINGERMNVVTEGDLISRGEKIKVSKVAGNRIVVKKIIEGDDN